MMPTAASAAASPAAASGTGRDAGRIVPLAPVRNRVPRLSLDVIDLTATWFPLPTGELAKPGGPRAESEYAALEAAVR
jgi:hypothetical protein